MDVLVYGLVESVKLALLAVGFSLVYGVSRLPNFAHGALYVIAGYVCWSIHSSLGLPYGLAITLAVICTAALGAALYRLILVRVRGMPIQEIIASYAIGLAVLEGFRYAGFRGTTYTLPDFADGTLELAGVAVDYQRLCVVGVGAAVVLSLWWFTHHTRLGLSMRAIAQDERAAQLLGIDTNRTALLAMALGSALAALAAVTVLPLGNITVKAGYDVLLQALAVCVVGGLGSWMGSILAAFVLGYAQALTVAVEPKLQMVVTLVAILVVLLARPSGLLGQQSALEERV